MKTKRILLLLVLSLIFLVGCNKTEEEVPEVPVDENGNPVEVQESVIPEINDYYGAFTRSVKVSDDMRNVLSARLQKCEEIQLLNPSDYWKEKNFASLTLNFLPVADILQHTCYLNETQTLMQDEEGNISYDWEACKQYVLSTYGENEIENVSLTRNSANNYEIQDEGEIKGSWGVYNGIRKTKAIYDANHDWSQTLTYINYGNEKTMGQMFEYGRQKTDKGKMSFVIQTLKERAYVTYDENGQLESFSYSRLNGDILTRYQERAFEILAEHNKLVDETNDFWSRIGMGNGIEELTELVPFDRDLEIDYTSYHLEEDSIFTHIDEITNEWVMELDPDFDLTISYDGKTLTVRFFNILSKKVEEYIFHENGSIDKSEKVIEVISVDELLKNIKERWAEEQEALWIKETEENMDFDGDLIIGKPSVEEEITETDTPTDENETGEKEEETVNAGDTE